MQNTKVQIKPNMRKKVLAMDSNLEWERYHNQSIVKIAKNTNRNTDPPV